MNVSSHLLQQFDWLDLFLTALANGNSKIPEFPTTVSQQKPQLPTVATQKNNSQS